jgi:hypothetical protein
MVCTTLCTGHTMPLDPAPHLELSPRGTHQRPPRPDTSKTASCMPSLAREKRINSLTTPNQPLLVVFRKGQGCSSREDVGSCNPAQLDEHIYVYIYNGHSHVADWCLCETTTSTWSCPAAEFFDTVHSKRSSAGQAKECVKRFFASLSVQQG